MPTDESFEARLERYEAALLTRENARIVAARAHDGAEVAQAAARAADDRVLRAGDEVLGARAALLAPDHRVLGPSGIARREPLWAELDDGIRETVRALWCAGFSPSDSWNGRKEGRKATMECALEVPNVFMQCEPGQLIAEAERLQSLIASWGLPDEPADGEPLVQASYAPGDGIGLLMLFGVDDARLAAAVGTVP